MAGPPSVGRRQGVVYIEQTPRLYYNARYLCCERRNGMEKASIGTKCVQGGYRPGNGQPRQIPIIQSTTFKYDTGDAMGKLFDLEASGYFYSRLQNPTVDAVAAKICELEGGNGRHAHLFRHGRKFPCRL